MYDPLLCVYAELLCVYDSMTHCCVCITHCCVCITHCCVCFRYHPSAGECSIQSCLHQFTAAELLTGNNKFGCKNCTKLKYKNNPHKGTVNTCSMMKSVQKIVTFYCLLPQIPIIRLFLPQIQFFLQSIA